VRFANWPVSALALSTRPALHNPNHDGESGRTDRQTDRPIRRKILGRNATGFTWRVATGICAAVTLDQSLGLYSRDLRRISHCADISIHEDWCLLGNYAV
jgi:hypothetical protein